MCPNPRRAFALSLLALFAAALLSAPALVAQEAGLDASDAVPFREGEKISFEDIERLRQYLPEEFWANRDFFFYEGMALEIGPFFRDYGPAPVYKEATRKNAADVRLGPESSLENYRSGQPFPMENIDCAGDPQAGAKLAWNFIRRWEGAGGFAEFYYSYWDRGEELPLYYQGKSRGISLAYRPEEKFESQAGDVFRGERRISAGGPSVDAPFDARGIMLLTYNYKSSFKTKAEMKNSDTWVYLPTLRRVRRISTAQRTDAVAGTDFTMDDLFSFNGIVPQYRWECLGEMDLIAPVNTRERAFPYNPDHNFGPYGLSYADDRWELRHAIKIRFVPNNSDHPYHHKDIYIDKNSMEPLYSFAYDRKQEMWKVITHNHRWSDDPEFVEYIGWDEVPEPRDLTVVSDTIVNVQTGTGNRIEFWARTGMPMKSKGRIRRYIDVGRLTKGR
ncbi:MAG: DUF1329 domain-containing protein [Myxococcota bacterium]|nr:DUF1329 domain-containing protein [Myxococcota bacterium]